MEIFHIVAVSIITFLIHFVLYILSQFDRKKKEEMTMIENAALILHKLDKIKKPIGGNKMEPDLKKVAKYIEAKLGAKIDAAKDEILEEMETKFEEISTQIDEVGEIGGPDPDEPGTEPEETPAEEDFDALLEDDPETADLPPPPPQPKKPSKELPESLDVSKRQIDTKKAAEEAEKKTKKGKGFFGRKKE